MLPMEGDAVLERSVMPAPVEDVTHLYDLDLSDPHAPRVDGHSTWSGRLVSLRQYDETVRLVTSTGLPDLPFVQPRPGGRSEAEAERANRQVVRESRIEDWLPGLDTGTSSGPLVDCADVHHPARPARRDPAPPPPRPWRSAPSGPDRSEPPARSPSPAPARRCTPPRTGSTSPPPTGGRRSAPRRTLRRPPTASWHRCRAHAPRSTPSRSRPATPATSPPASVDGTVRDRWSLDERDGFLRVAVSWPNRQGGTRENGIVVLDERGTDLVRGRRLRGLGRRRGHPVGAVVRRPGRRRHLPPGRPALHDRPERPDPSAPPRRAEDPGLLLLPAPDR